MCCFQVRKTTKRGVCSVTVQEGAPWILRADQKTCGLQKDQGVLTVITKKSDKSERMREQNEHIWSRMNSRQSNDKLQHNLKKIYTVFESWWGKFTLVESSQKLREMCVNQSFFPVHRTVWEAINTGEWETWRGMWCCFVTTPRPSTWRDPRSETLINVLFLFV